MVHGSSGGSQVPRYLIHPSGAPVAFLQGYMRARSQGGKWDVDGEVRYRTPCELVALWTWCGNGFVPCRSACPAPAKHPACGMRDSHLRSQQTLNFLRRADFRCPPNRHPTREPKRQLHYKLPPQSLDLPHRSSSSDLSTIKSR